MAATETAAVRKTASLANVNMMREREREGRKESEREREMKVVIWEEKK